MTFQPDVYCAHTHEDLLNTVPTLFGFVPRECVVAISVTGPTSRFGFRLRHDLPEPGEEDPLAGDLASHLVRNGGDGFFVIALSADVDRARTMALALQDALPPRSCRLVIWADDERSWSDLPDHPAEGVPYRIVDHHPARVHAVTNGQVVHASRDALRVEVERPDSARNAWLDQAHDRIVEDVVRRALDPDVADLADAECRRVSALVERALAGGHLTDGELVELVVRVSCHEVRDVQWYRIGRENARAHHALWSAACRVASPDFAPPVLSLAGFAAWQWGDGARALVAAETALRIDPDYVMAQLLGQILTAGLHPDLWHSMTASA